MTTCPRCGSTRIKRSRSRNLKERVFKFFDRRAYRCVACGWRGILKGKSSRSKAHAKKYTPLQIILIIIVIFIATMGVLYWATREESKPEYPVQGSVGNHTEALASARLPRALPVPPVPQALAGQAFAGTFFCGGYS